MPYVLSGFDDKVAVVTGSGRMRSIGRSIAVELARAGCDLALTGTGKSPERYPDAEQKAGWRDVESVAEEARGLGRRVHTTLCDVADVASVEGLAAEVMEVFGRVDIVVNTAAAAYGPDRMPLVDIKPEVWQHVQDVNLFGPYLMCRAFAPHMIEANRGGSIVNISSVASKNFPRDRAAYAASKAGLNAMTASMAKEVGPAGIRVNAICVGPVATSRAEHVTQTDSFAEFIQRDIPLQRMGTGEDIAHSVVFLCSDEGAWVTGQAWNVDGGRVVAR
jgi:3-oxoacyl-[acyl-carrier protein] reductase